MEHSVEGSPPIQNPKSSQGITPRRPGSASHRASRSDAPSMELDLRFLFHHVVELPLPVAFTDLLKRIDAT